MAKIVVKNSRGDRVPFLRGVLVQSLVSVGLPFNDAYAVAQSVRDELSDTGVEELASGDLRRQVAEVLQERFGSALRHRYESSPVDDRGTIVRTPTK